MRLQVLGSSSKANCYILTSQSGILILDCGVPFKVIQKALNFDLSDVAGCLCTHSHADHSKAIPDLTRAGIECLMSVGTAQAILPEGKYFHRVTRVKAYEQIKVGGFDALPFSLEHDVENYGYLVCDTASKFKLLYLTDTYYCRNTFRGVNAILCECNYISDTLQANVAAGLIAPEAADRLRKSHFELGNVIKFLQASDLTQCQKIILCHLSDRNSDAARMVREVHKSTGIETIAADTGMDIELSKEPY